MKAMMLGLMMSISGAAFAGERANCEIDTYLRFRPRILSTGVKDERSERSALDCVSQAFRVSEKLKGDSVKGRILDTISNPGSVIDGKFSIRTDRIYSENSCEIDFFIPLEPGIFSTWAIAERSNLSGYHCLQKAIDLSRRAERVNVRINEYPTGMKAKFRIRKQNPRGV